MAYRPYTFTSTAAAQKAVAWDENRTNLVITNISAETVYMGVDATVTNSGTSQGAPIFNNGRFSASYGEGLNPTIERWLVGTAGGTILIFEEFAPDPYLAATQKLNDAITMLIDVITRSNIPAPSPSTQEKPKS